MQAISLDQVSDELIRRLQRLAEQSGSNIETEALQCLEKGLSEREQIEAELKELRELRGKSNGAWLTDAMIRAARDEGRE